MSGEGEAEGFIPQNGNKMNQRIQEMNEELEDLRRELQDLRDRRLLAPIEPQRKDRR